MKVKVENTLCQEYISEKPEEGKTAKQGPHRTTATHSTMAQFTPG